MEISKEIYNKIKDPFINFCVKFGITATHITLFNHFITLTFGCYFFSRGTYIYGLLALMVCFINGFLDYLDGDVARKTNKTGKLGEWLDGGFDIIIQNVVLCAIGFGCIKNGMDILWLGLFFIGNSSCNFVSFNYNSTFGFDSYNGNEIFRREMKFKNNIFNKIIADMIDPTISFLSLFIYTLRYWIIIGVIFNVMTQCFIIFTIITNIRWAVLYIIYAFYLTGYKNLYVLNVLSLLDEERPEFYTYRARG